MELLLLGSGVALLYFGGEGLVRGGAALGKRLGLSSLVIGLTIVSTGTSSPELAATLAAVLEGAPAVAFGNVVGSNIANLGLVLGLSAVILPMSVAAPLLRRDLPLLLAVSLLLFWLVEDGRIGRLEGLFLLALLVVYLVYLLRSWGVQQELKDGLAEGAGAAAPPVWKSALLILGGIGLLVLGAHLLISGAVGLARMVGVSERVIGLTAVAFGTSLPELASCLVAVARREADLVLGNLIGSNVFNILLILGAAATVHPIAVEAAIVRIDLIAMVALSLIVWVFLATGRRLSRGEGILLVTLYGAYVIYLFV